MRRTTHTRRRRLVPIALVSAGAVALGLVGLTVPANAAASDVAEAEGQMLSGAGALNIDSVAALKAAYSATPSGASPVTSNLNASLLGSALNLNLGTVPLLSNLTSPGIVQIGADGQYARTAATGAAYGASGVLDSSGAITAGATDGSTDTKLNLTSLLGQAGVNTTGVLDQLEIDLGAISASATGTPGSPVGYSGAYQVAGGKLIVHSSAVANVDNTLSTTLSGVSSTLNSALSGDSTSLTGLLSGLTGTLGGVLSGLGVVNVSGLAVNAKVTTPDLSNLLSTVGTISSGATANAPAGTVTINLSTGEIVVDLGKLLASQTGKTDGTLNGLPANTDLLTGATVQNALGGAINSAIAAAVTAVQTALDNQLDGSTVDVSVTGKISTAALVVAGITVAPATDIANINIDASGTLGDLLNNNGTNFTITDTSTLLDNLISLGSITGPITTALTNTVLPAVSTLLQGELSTLNSQIASLGTGLGNTLGNATSGLLGTVNQVADIIVNVQNTTSSTPKAAFTTAGAGTAGFTERALQVNLLPAAGSSAVTVNLASASVRSTNNTTVAAITATPASIPAGSTETINGTGFAPSQAVTVTFTDASGHVLGTTTATPAAGGTFTATWPVPAGTAAGTVTATATQGDTSTGGAGYTASTTFQVTTSSSGTATAGTATSGTATSGTATSGTATSGTATSGTATSGTATAGTATSGTATSGTATAGTATSGTATAGTATAGTATAGTATAGTATSGTATSGTATSGTATAGTATAGTATAGTATAGTATSGTATAGTATTGTATSGTATSGTATAGTATSGTQGVITPGKVTITPAPGNTLGVGQTLIGNPGTWSPAGTSLTYTWTLPNGTVIGTGQTLIVPASASGKAITLTVTGSKPGYKSASATATAGISPNTAPQVIRIWGQDRYETALTISQDTFPVNGSAPVVFVASGANFPDALSAAPAAAKLGGPLLLTQPTVADPRVLNEIKRLGAKRIYVVGGPAAVSTGVSNALAKVAPVTRLGGADRYATSLLVAKTVFGTASVPSAFVATGANFPDALSASAYAGLKHEPVVLVNPAQPTVPAVASYLKTAKTTSLSIAGGPAAVSATTASALAKAIGTMPKRFGGADRYQTSQLINAQFASAPRVYLATGALFPDALTGAAAAARLGAPLYVVHPNCVPGPVLSSMSKWKTGTIKVLGGPAALTNDVMLLKSCS